MSNQNPGGPPNDPDSSQPAAPNQYTSTGANVPAPPNQYGATATNVPAPPPPDSNYSSSPDIVGYEVPTDIQPVARPQGQIYGVLGAPIPPPVVTQAAQRLQNRAAKVDLALGSLDPSQGGVELRHDIISNARIARTGGGRFAQYFKRFFSSGTGNGATPSELRDELIDREIARAYKNNPKVKQLLGQVSADRQTDISTALAENNLSTLLQPFGKKPPKSLKGDDLAAYKEVQHGIARVKKLLGLKADAPISDDDINTLYESGDDTKIAAAHDLLAAASRACKRSAVIDAVLEGSDVVPVRYNVTGPDPVDSIETSTAYIKALRSKITNMVFQGELPAALVHAATLILDDPEQIKKLYACVGFNRVMSPNNLRGASLSSDIDFKLVFDDTKMDEARANVLMSRMYKALESIGESFSADLGLTLEVQEFALKGLRKLATQASTIEAEKNFLTTAVENQVLMSGDPEVQEAFTKIIKTKLLAAAATNPDEPGLPVRVFDQYLGDSDKGSIRTIKYLTKIQAAMEETVDKILADADLSALARKKLQMTSSADLGRALKKPESLLAVLGDETFHQAAIKKKLVDGIPPASDVPMFADKDDYDRFKALTKNLKAFHTDTGSFIGSDDADEGNWVFSNKFSACRINDFFDSVSAERYRAYKGVLGTDGAEPDRTYHPGVAAALDARFKNARHVAGGINGFAIQLQMLVYRKYMATTDHEDIDALYDKMTADQFDEPALRSRAHGTPEKEHRSDDCGARRSRAERRRNERGGRCVSTEAQSPAQPPQRGSERSRQSSARCARNARLAGGRGWLRRRAGLPETERPAERRARRTLPIARRPS